MIWNGINIVFNSNTNPANWTQLNPRFINLLWAFFVKQGIIEIFVNSTFRTDKGSFHGVGMALDLHYVKYKSGKIIYFSRKETDYNLAEDMHFGNLINEYFKQYRIEFFSPARIISYKSDRYNYYAGESDSFVLKKISEKGNGKIDLDRDHLDHLHIAINPDPTTKKKAKIKDTLKELLPVAIFFLG